MPNNIQIAVIDDHPLLREGVVMTLGAEPDIEVVGQGDKAADAIRLAHDLLPDVILLDIHMDGGGINAARTIAADYPVVKTVMLTVSEDEENVLAAIKAGARGYILKGVSARDLVSIVRAVHAGESYVTPSLAASLLVDFHSNVRNSVPGPRDPFDELTKRERQILKSVATGASNKEIANELYLSEKTVKHYMTNILQKLHVSNRVQAALLAQEAARSDLTTATRNTESNTP